MDDIADRLGVSKGTMYRSVESKEALFAAVLTYGDEPDALAPGRSLPPIEWTELSVRLRDGLAAAVNALDLTAAVTTGARRPPKESVADEVERLALDVYSMLSERRVTVMVRDRCAAEIPAITGDWYELGRYALVDLWVRYLDRRRQHLHISIEHWFTAISCS